MSCFWRKALHRTFILVLLGGVFLGSADRVKSASGPIDARPQARARAAERYVQFSEAARQVALRPDQSPFDPAAVVMRIGTDPAALRRFVKEQIAWEPSFGIVRGAEGTMAAQAGGDWDRANLLKKILAEAGYASRFKVIERTDAQAAAVVDAWLKGPSPMQALFTPAAAWPDRPAIHPAAKLLGQFGIPLKNVEIHAAIERSRWKGMIDASFDASAIATASIEKALADAGQKGQAFDAWRAPLLAAAKERIVIEIAGLNGTTGGSILDVSPDAGPPTAAQLQSARPFDRPPPQRVGQFTIQLHMNVAGKESDDDAPSILLLDHTEMLEDLFDRPIRLEIVPADPAAAAKPAAQWSADDWYRFVSGFKQFQAILHVGPQSTASKAFDLQGNVHAVSPDGRIAGASQLGGGIASGFGGALGGGGAAEKPKKHIDALVLRMVLTLPGQKPITRDRLIYGMLRPGVSPVYTADMLITGGPVGAGPMAWMMLDAVTHNAPILAKLWTSEDPARFSAPIRPMRLPVMLYRWQYGRLALVHRLLQSSPSLTAAGGPLIVLRTTQMRIDEKARRIGERAVMDLVLDQQCLLPRSADAVPLAVRANITAGTGATVLESVLLQQINPAAATHGAFATAQDARANGIQEVLASTAATPAQLKLDPLVQWVIGRSDSAAVRLFCRPERPAAWWEIDPATGRTIGRGDGGEGQSAMEYAQTVKMNLSNLKCMLALANAGIMGTSSNNAMAGQWLACVTGADNPGSYVGAVGNVQDVYGIGGGLAAAGDCLGGAWDLASMAGGN